MYVDSFDLCAVRLGVADHSRNDRDTVRTYDQVPEAEMSVLWLWRTHAAMVEE